MQRFELAFMMACDVERRRQKRGEKPHSGWKPAKYHFGSGTEAHPEGKRLFGEIRLLGAATLMNDLKGAKRLIIPGKIEQRYADEEIEIGGAMEPPWQGFILRKILVEDYGVEPSVVEWIRSDGGTFEAVRSIVDKIRDLGLQFRDVIVVTNKYHHERVYEMLRDFRAYEVCVRSAESLLMAADEVKNKKILESELDPRQLRDRDLEEARGIGAFISRRYQPRRHGWKKIPIFR